MLGHWFTSLTIGVMDAVGGCKSLAHTGVPRTQAGGDSAFVLFGDRASEMGRTLFLHIDPSGAGPKEKGRGTKTSSHAIELIPVPRPS